MRCLVLHARARGLWVWAVRRATEEEAYVLGGALLALGLAAYVAFGARRQAPE
ncbi:MAG: hypothetical protein M3P96_10245 [Actinomycetota bacterium]|nr:hypothetical protein [Actinomycetota bacterium]